MSEESSTTQGTENQQAPAQTPGIFGQAPQTPAQTAQPAADDGRDYEAEIAKLRAENAKWRTQLRDTEGKLKEIEPAAQKLAEIEEAAKSEEQKLREQLEALKAEKLKAQAAAELANKQAKLIAVAAKAGVSPDVVELLDITKLDLENEEATINTLKKLAPAKLTGGGASNPPGEQNGTITDGDLRNLYFGGGRGPKNLIFGGNK